MANGYGEPATGSSNGNHITIDMRSDTLTLPTPAMMEAIQNAKLGDAIYGEDPSTIELQNLAASLLGKEDSVLVPSGTMSNLVAVWSHCTSRGSSVILGDKSHIHEFEQGGIASVAGVMPRVIRNMSDGSLNMSDLEKCLPSKDPHKSSPKLICLENTHNVCGGKVVPMDHIAQVRKFADKHNMKLHLDGSRVFNAATKLGLPVHEVVKDFDSVNICLSKGLAGPVGSLLVGSKEFMTEAIKGKKVFGGAMRQAGIIAAPGLVSLKVMTKRLQEDHDNAFLLAKGLAELSQYGIECDYEDTETNIVLFKSKKVPPAVLLKEISSPTDGYPCVKMMNFVEGNVRCVTSYQISKDDINMALERVEYELSKLCDSGYY